MRFCDMIFLAISCQQLAVSEDVLNLLFFVHEIAFLCTAVLIFDW